MKRSLNEDASCNPASRQYKRGLVEKPVSEGNRPASDSFPAAVPRHPRHAHHWSLPSHTQRMHPRNRYKDNPPDLTGLVKGMYGAAYADALAPFVKIDPNSQAGHVDWQDPKACYAITQVLLAKDFGVQGWQIPAGYLVPPVPGRLNHILWAQDLLSIESTLPATHKPRVIDLGTGANFIYPLLGSREAGWGYTLALDCDAVALKAALGNAQAAGLQDEVELRQAPMLAGWMERGPLGSALRPEDGSFDLLVCNPPFFASSEEAQARSKVKEDCQTDAGHGGTSLEMICHGGEAQFISALVEDSVHLGAQRVRWYVVLVGKKATLSSVTRKMKELGVHNIRTTRFFQGKTIRWGLAWSLSNDGCDARGRPPADALAAVNAHLAEKQRGKPLAQFVVAAPEGGPCLSVAEVLERVRSFLDEYRALTVVCGMDAGDDNTLEATLQDAFVAGDGCGSKDVHLEVAAEEVAGSPSIRVEVRSAEGDTLAEIAPKARGLVDGMEGEVARTNRRWRRILAKQMT